MDTYSLPLQTVKLICNCDNISRGETAGDCWRQTKTHLFLTSSSRTQLGRAGFGGEIRFSIFSAGIIKDSKLAGHVHQSVRGGGGGGERSVVAIYVSTLIHQISGRGTTWSHLHLVIKTTPTLPSCSCSNDKGYIITVSSKKSNLK